ncbi:hypothetical protein [Cupriavidus sp. Marseille-Q8015]
MKRVLEWLRASPVVSGLLAGAAIAFVALLFAWALVWFAHWLPWPPKG